MPDLKNAKLTWLEDGSPYSTQFDDIYFSSQGALQESQHVFIAANRLAQRWTAHGDPTMPFTVVEFGFGAGLNFLLCWQLLDQLNRQDLRLHYLAFEKHPLTRADLDRALANWSELSAFSSKLLAVYIDHTRGLHRYHVADNLTLDLYLGDAITGISETLGSASASVDCWFMDGFSPTRNPDLWSPPLAARMWQYSCPGATASSYSVAGQVRRNLQSAGFLLEKLPGFGNKREMLLARRPDCVADPTNTLAENPASSLRAPPARPTNRRATVIGAGIAGCSTAYSLARKGWQVTLLDEATAIASGASGNPQAVLQPRLAANRDSQSRFYLHALLYAYRQFTAIQQQQEINWHPCGVLRLPQQRRKGLGKLLEHPGEYYSERVLSRLSRQQASELAGLPVSGEALWIPYGGWLEPTRLCQAYLDAIPESLLTLVTGQKVTGLESDESGWRIFGAQGLLAESAVVVIANSYQARSLTQTASLPLVPIAGQLSRAAATPQSKYLKTVVVAAKYICPAADAMHSLGASYVNQPTNLNGSTDTDQENLLGVSAAFDNLSLSRICGARVSVRCNASDYFPIVGAVPDLEEFIRVFAPLSKDATASIDARVPCLPGLFVNVAHGSYGMTSCPLAAELVASQVNGDLPPLTAALVGSLSPARFIIRDLKRQRDPAWLSRDQRTP